jgi:gluconokinase
VIGHVVIMGPAGNGKSTLGAALAEALGLPFIEGDSCHPPANVAKMASGQALTDADRAPFLAEVGARLAAKRNGAVASCSALKRVYRDMLRAKAGPILFVLPDVTGHELTRRIANRPGHFMPPSQVADQLDTLERPAPDEEALVIDGRLPTQEQVAAIVARLAA